MGASKVNMRYIPKATKTLELRKRRDKKRLPSYPFYVRGYSEIDGERHPWIKRIIRKRSIGEATLEMKKIGKFYGVKKYKVCVAP